MNRDQLYLKYFNAILSEFRKVDIYQKFIYYIGINRFTFKELNALTVLNKIEVFKTLIKSTSINSEEHFNLYYLDSEYSNLLNVELKLDVYEKKELKELREEIINLTLGN